MNIAIRQFKASDTQSLIKMFDDFGDYFVPLDPLKRIIRGPGYGEYYVNKALREVEKYNGKFYIAVDNTKFVGFVVCIIKKQSEEDMLSVIPTKPGRVTELYVDPEYRGKGIGTVLLKKAEEFFIQNQCSAVFIEVFAPNQGAHEFYQSQGYRDRDIDMIKVLER